MSDSLGNIAVPAITPCGTFPIVTEYPFGESRAPQVAIHQFGSGNAKIEQRFLLGNGARRFVVQRPHLTEAERTALRDFWEVQQGGYGAFTYNTPNEDGTFTGVVVRFDNQPLSWEFFLAYLSQTGVTLVEVPQTTPTYCLQATETRFPDADTLAPALLSQVQQVIPLIHIVPKQTGYPDNIYVSDQRFILCGPRQSLDEEYLELGPSIFDEAFPNPILGGSALIAFAHAQATGDYPVISDTQGNSWTQLFPGTDTIHNAAWAISAAPGADTVIFNPTSFSNGDYQILEFNGVAEVDATAILDSVSPVGGAVTISLTTGSTPGTRMLVAWVEQDSGGGITPIPPAGWCTAVKGFWMTAFCKEVDGPGTYSVTFTGLPAVGGGEGPIQLAILSLRLNPPAGLYQARLLDWDGISQSLGNESDQASFTFGNADRVMTQLANDVDLFRASIEFSLYHVGTGIKIDLWKGEIIDWQADGGPEFTVTAADGMYELTLPYPTRQISRSCWKDFNDGQNCPFAVTGGGHTASALDLVHFPTSADASFCDKSYDGPNGCLAHTMNRFFGGVYAEPQQVRVLDNSTGVFGFGRSKITSVSLVAETIFDQFVQECYTDVLMPVNAKLASGRDEGDYYEAMAVVSEGPITLWVPTGVRAFDSFGNLIGSQLDGQFNHGYPGSFGFRGYNGTDPAGATDYFSLDQGAPLLDAIANANLTDPAWRLVQSGSSVYKNTFAAGTAFEVIRRKKASGLELTTPEQHTMTVMVSAGMGVWIWSAPGTRTWWSNTNKPIWIAINMMLRARGYRAGANLTSAQLDACETLFDIDAAVAAETTCDTSVASLIGSGTENQFTYRGIIQDQKPLRDHITETLMNCLGYYSYEFGKLKVGIRSDASAVEAFTVGNILFQSLQLGPVKPQFNDLTANFADMEFQFALNNVRLYDIDNAKLIGSSVAPLFLKASINLSGTGTKSQAGRIITTRLREELGGVNSDEWAAARNVQFGTTILALNVEPGMVCSMTHVDMPDGSGKFRVQSWKLNKDYSIDIQGKTVTDSMYTLDAGVTIADVTASPVPTEFGNPPAAKDFTLIADADGTLDVSMNVDPTVPFTGFDLALTGDDETARTAAPTTLSGSITSSAATATLGSVSAVVVGQYINVDLEIIQITGPGSTGSTPTSTTVNIARGQLLSTAASHSGGAEVYPLTTKATIHYDFPAGYDLAQPTIITGPDAPYKQLSASLSGIGRFRVLYAALFLDVVESGQSPETDTAFLEPVGTAPSEDNVPGALPGVRISDGQLLTIHVDGPLEVAGDLAPDLSFPSGITLGITYATVGTAPTGADIQFRLDTVYPDNSVVDGGVTGIPATTTSSGEISSGAQGGKMDGLRMRLTVLQVGSTEPGRDLTVYFPY